MTYWTNIHNVFLIGEIGTAEIWAFFLTAVATAFFTMFMTITDKEFKGNWVGFYGAGINWVIERFKK